MENRNQELMKNTIVLGIGQIVPKIIALFVLPLLTTYLTKEDYGLYELTLSVASFCIPLLSVQIQQGVFRFLLDSNKEKETIIVTSFYFVLFMYAVAAWPIIVGWNLYTHDIILGIIFFLGYMAEMLLNWLGQVARGIGYNIVYSLAYVIYSVLFIFMLLLFVEIQRLNVKSVIFSMIIAYGVSFGFIWIKLNIEDYFKKTQWNLSWLKELLRYSAPMVISSISLWIVNLSDRFFVSAFLGIQMTAVYSVANKIPNLFNSVYNIFNLAWTENTSKLTAEEKQGQYYSNFFEVFFNAIVGLMIALITVSPALFKFLISSKYAESYGLMSWLYVGVFLSSLVAFLGSIYVGEKKTRNVGISSAIGSIMNVIINLIFMKRFGVIVAALSTIISYLIICVYRAIDIKKYIHIIYKPFTIICGVTIVCVVAAINYEFSIKTTIISAIVTIIYNFYFNRFIIKKIIFSIVNKKNVDKIE